MKNIGKHYTLFVGDPELGPFFGTTDHPYVLKLGQKYNYFFKYTHTSWLEWKLFTRNCYEYKKETFYRSKDECKEYCYMKKGIDMCGLGKFEFNEIITNNENRFNLMHYVKNSKQRKCIDRINFPELCKNDCTQNDCEQRIYDLEMMASLDNKDNGTKLVLIPLRRRNRKEKEIQVFPFGDYISILISIMGFIFDVTMGTLCYLIFDGVKNSVIKLSIRLSRRNTVQKQCISDRIEEMERQASNNSITNPNLLQMSTLNVSAQSSIHSSSNRSISLCGHFILEQSTCV